MLGVGDVMEEEGSILTNVYVVLEVARMIDVHLLGLSKNSGPRIIGVCCGLLIHDRGTLIETCCRCLQTGGCVCLPLGVGIHELIAQDVVVAGWNATGAVVLIQTFHLCDIRTTPAKQHREDESCEYGSRKREVLGGRDRHLFGQ